MKIKCRFCSMEKEQGKSDSQMCVDCENNFFQLKEQINLKISKQKKMGVRSYV